MSSKGHSNSNTTGDQIDLARIFKPVEHAVLARVVGRPKLLPDWATHIDLNEFPKAGWEEAIDGIAPTRPIQKNRYALGNTAARIALATIQHRLPQWASFTPGQGIIHARTLRRFPVRKVNSQPLFLFSINWADSGPGISWPESYHVTWIAYYDRFLVTASFDSKDLFDFEDLELDSFAGSSESGADLHQIRDIIVSFWRMFESHEFDAWQGVSKTGVIKERTALAWRSRVWGRNHR
jgi:hypothetical protein